MNRVRRLMEELRQHLDTGQTAQAAETLEELESWVGTEKSTNVSECEQCGSENLDFRPPEYQSDDTLIQRIPCRDCEHVQIETWVLKSVEEGDG